MSHLSSIKLPALARKQPIDGSAEGEGRGSIKSNSVAGRRGERDRGARLHREALRGTPPASETCFVPSKPARRRVREPFPAEESCAFWKRLSADNSVFHEPACPERSGRMNRASIREYLSLCHVFQSRSSAGPAVSAAAFHASMRLLGARRLIDGTHVLDSAARGWAVN